MRKHAAVRISATLAALFMAPSRLAAQPLAFSHFAGTTGGADAIDGTARDARFASPNAAAFDAAGNLYLADSDNHTIRKMTRSGAVTTLAGLAGSPGSADGTGSAARFAQPYGVAVDGSSHVFVADRLNYTIRKIDVVTGTVTTLAGRAGSSGSADGAGRAARFNLPCSVAVDGSGNVFVADEYEATIRMVTPAGVVSTFAGSPGQRGNVDGTGAAARFNSPRAVATDSAGNVYVADEGSHTIRKITPQGAVTTLAGSSMGMPGSQDGTGAAAGFRYPGGIAVDPSGILYVADTDNGSIRRVTPAGVVTTLAGTDAFGSVDGTGSAATFALPYGTAVDPEGNVVVTEGGSVLRKVTPSGVVTTIAGLASAYGNVDATGLNARFWTPIGVAASRLGNVYVADSHASTIRKILPDAAVTTFAGKDGVAGASDGQGASARFSGPSGVAVDSAENIYVADYYNNTVRKITPSGAVSTLAGLAGSSGSADGTGSAARFSNPSALATDAAGNVYVADGANFTIRKIVVATGAVTTLAGLAGNYGSADGAGSAARFIYPQGVATDASGNVYVADTNNHTIRRITPSGDVTTLAGSAGSPGSMDGVGSGARFFYPYGVTVDAAGNVWVADTFNDTLRKVTPTGVVTTEAGASGVAGSSDGSGSGARFNMPTSLGFTPSGRLYVADLYNAAIRLGVPATFLDAATIDSPTGLIGQVRQLDTLPQAATNWQWSLIRNPSSSAAELSAANVRNPTFTPDVPDVYVFRLTASDASGAQSITTVSLTATTSNPPPGPALTRLLPIVLDVSSGSAHYVTEMALTNNGMTMLSVSMLYTASLGSKQGSGTVTDSLAPGEQKKIGDVLSYLRDKGLAIPSSSEQPQQGGTLLVSFQGSAAIVPRLVSATARTAALTGAPQPPGRAGLAYSGLLETETSASSVTLYGLRSTPTDRTNVAVFNTSGDPVTLKVTVCSGAGDGRCVVFRAAETLPPYGWLQYGSNEILDGNGITRGWATVEQTAGAGSFGAYAVINDNTTNDGSFVLPAGGAIASPTLTVPVLVETPVFRSELILANKGMVAATLGLSYVESISPALGGGGTAIIMLASGEEQIIPEPIDLFRRYGFNIGAKDAASYGGALRITVSGTTAINVFAGARTASLSPAGGLFGLFTPCVYSGQEASSEAYLYGLRADAENRTNVAVVNTGDFPAGPILLQLQAYDGDAGGVPKGEPVSVSLSPGQWAQPGNFFKTSGVVNGWVKVTRMSGTAPWIAYGVINDGGNPGERTGDGAYVPMVK
jgi:sugar lactone lactonase YvrE